MASRSSTTKPRLLPASLKQNLRRYQLVTRAATTRGGAGERRSRSKGEGIEFEDFRPYAFGDDMRRLDPHVYARLGEHVVRRYNVPERLEVVLLVDMSASMRFGVPPKSDFARAVALGLAMCALANSDTVRCGVILGGGVHWYDRLAGVGRLDDLEAWLTSRRAEGGGDLAAALRTAGPRLGGGGLCVLISDLWCERPVEAVEHLVGAGRDLVVVRVLAPEEVDPFAYGPGPTRISDVETGEEVEVELGTAAREAYVALMTRRTEGLRREVQAKQGIFVDLTCDLPLSDVFDRRLREAQVIR